MSQKETRARVGRPQYRSKLLVVLLPAVNKAAPLFWFFGDFRCGVWLHVFMIININIGKHSC